MKNKIYTYNWKYHSQTRTIQNIIEYWLTDYDIKYDSDAQNIIIIV